MTNRAALRGTLPPADSAARCLAKCKYVCQRKPHTPQCRDRGGIGGQGFHGVIFHRANDYESLGQFAAFVIRPAPLFNDIEFQCAGQVIALNSHHSSFRDLKIQEGAPCPYLRVD